MKAQIRKKKHGFTIIEVVLVLAIAGLIFLMIFIALPALQRSQRDAQRRSDISLLLSKIADFKTNNRGALPTGAESSRILVNQVDYGMEKSLWRSFYSYYFDDSFSDPKRNDRYFISIAPCGASTRGSVCKWDYDTGSGFESTQLKQDMDNVILINTGATCNGQTAVQSSNPRNVAAQYFLEGGGVYCAST